MRQLLPEVRADVDPLDVYGRDDRTAPVPGRPWVLVNMISTVDGATAIEGRSGGLGGPADKRVFAAVRSLADVILVGAGTARAEGYGPARLDAAAAPHRAERGQADVPRIAVVTRSLDLDLEGRLFTEADPAARPIVVTSRAADADRRARTAERADVLTAGEGTVDLVDALQQLADLGGRVVVCEGGPTLNGQLVAADAVDELTLSFSPLLAAGTSARVAQGPSPMAPLEMTLGHLLEEDGLLFLRYVRARRRAGVNGASAPSPS